MDDEQIAKFIAHLDQEDTERKAIFYLLIFTGMRRGELLGLQWDDIDFDNKTIRIQRTIQYTPELGIYEDTTKTEGSDRVIKTSDAVLTVLKQHQAEQRLQQFKCGDLWKNDTNKLFTTWDGGFMHPNTPYKMLQGILKKNNMPAVSLHSLRHSNASILISSGANIKAVSSRLGHSNVSTTLNIYTEQIKSAAAAAAEALDAALLPSAKIS